MSPILLRHDKMKGSRLHYFKNEIEMCICVLLEKKRLNKISDLFSNRIKSFRTSCPNFATVYFLSIVLRWGHFRPITVEPFIREYTQDGRNYARNADVTFSKFDKSLLAHRSLSWVDIKRSRRTTGRTTECFHFRRICRLFIPVQFARMEFSIY